MTIMTDYVQLGREAALAKKRHEQEELARQRAREDQVIRRYEDAEGQVLNRNLATIFGADADDPEFRNLTWRFIGRPCVTFDGDRATFTATDYLAPLAMVTRFQGVEIVANLGTKGYGAGAWFSVRRGDSSGGFDNLASFGEQVGWLYPDLDAAGSPVPHRVA